MHKKTEKLHINYIKLKDEKQAFYNQKINNLKDFIKEIKETRAVVFTSEEHQKTIQDLYIAYNEKKMSVMNKLLSYLNILEKENELNYLNITTDKNLDTINKFESKHFHVVNTKFNTEIEQIGSYLKSLESANKIMCFKNKITESDMMKSFFPDDDTQISLEPVNLS